jgi:hypothetical protein
LQINFSYEIIEKQKVKYLAKLFDAFPNCYPGIDKILSDIFSTGIPFKETNSVHFLKDGN